MRYIDYMIYNKSKDRVTPLMQEDVDTASVGGSMQGNSISREEYKANGFKEVWGIGDKDLIRRFCMKERFYLTKMVDIDTALYSDERPEGFVIEEELGEDKKYIAFKLGLRGFVVFTDGYGDPEIDYFIKREKRYWERAREIGRKKKRESGGFAGGAVPYGYYRANKKLYVDDYESFIVKFVFYRYSQGCGYGGIAKELRLRGFRNRKGNPFSAGSIESILKNRRFYQGYFNYDGKEIKGNFRGILEDTEELLTEEWKKRVFDAETEAKIAEHVKKYHGDRAVPKSVTPYIIADDHLDGKIKTRRMRSEHKGSI